MSSVAMDWAWTRPVRGPRQHVLLALAKKVRPKTDVATPSMPELMEMTGLSESTIRAHIQAMSKAGIIAVDVSNGGRHKRSTYTLTGVLTPREMWGSGVEETPQEKTPCGPETPQLPVQNPPTDGPVGLRPNREQEVVSTPDADASAGSQAEMFHVEEPPKPQTTRQIAKIERGEIVTVNRGHAVAAWCEGYAETHDAKVTQRQKGQVSRESGYLLDAGNPPERVLIAARSAGRRGFATVEKEYNSLAKRRDVAQPAAHAAPPRPSTTDARVAAGLALAEKFARQEAAG